MSITKHKSAMHTGHRDRMRKKYREQGFDYFEDHEILEMLLYYVVPRRDTNPLAHNLLAPKPFGSISKVLDADFLDLKEFGLTDKFANFIKFIRTMIDFYLEDRQKTRSKHIYPDNFVSHFKNSCICKNQETMYALLTDVEYRMLFCGALSQKAIGNTDVLVEELLEWSLMYNAQYVILSHIFPSDCKVQKVISADASEKIKEALSNISVRLDDYILLSQDELVPATKVPYYDKVDILSAFLDYVYSQRDTKELALALFDHFGSMSAICDANISALKKCGLSDNAAIFIKFIPDITRVYIEDKNKSRFKQVFPDNLCSFFRYKYVGRHQETLYTLLLDDKYKIKYCGILSKGSISSTDVPVKKLTELCLEHKPKYAVVSHNHPHTISIPSTSDIETTELLRDSLNKIKVKLIDHIIVSDTDETPISKFGLYSYIFK